MRPRPAAIVVALVLLSTIACNSSADDPSGERTTTTASDTSSPAPTLPTSTTTTVALPPAVQVEWHGCGGGFECATVAVPVSYQEPTGPTLDLALVKNPADDPGERIGTLLVNPGGPGASGVRRVARGFQISPEVADRFDIVGFDPRGIGQSSPISCGDAVPAFRATDLSPDTPDEEQALEAAARAVADECSETEGDRLPHYGSVEVVHDIEVIRRALGEERVSFVGISYGTLLGQLWAEWYPDSVRAMVLDGVVSTSSEDDGSDTQEKGVQRTFDLMAAACEADASCPVADDGGPLAAYDALADHVEDGTVSGGGVGPTQLAYAVFWASYDEERWARLWAAVDQGLAGDLAAVAEMADSFTQIVDYAPFAIVSCLDSPHPTDVDDWREASRARRARSPRFGEILANELLPCAFWSEATLDSVVVDAAGAPPILVVGSTGDAATPYETAVSAAERLDSGALLTVDLEGHIAIGDSGCADAAITRYLVDLTVPDEGTRC